MFRCFKKPIKLNSRQAEELAGLVVRQRAGTVPFDDQSLEGFTPWILTLGQVVRELDGYLHNRIVRLAHEPRKCLLTTRSLLWHITPRKVVGLAFRETPLTTQIFQF